MKFLEKILSSGLYFLAFILPLQTRLFIRPGTVNGGYFEYGTISLFGTDILLILLLILFVFTPSPGQERAGVRLVARCKHIIDRLFARYSGRNSTSSCPSPGQEKELYDKKLSIKRNLFYLIIALNLAALISIFFTADKLVAVQAYIKLTLGMGLFFLVSQAAYEYVKLIYAFLAGAMVQATLGIWQFLSQATFASKWLGLAAHPAEVGGNSVIETLAGGRWLRAYGGLDHPNVLGGLLAISLLLIVCLMLTDGVKTKIINYQLSITDKIQNSIFYSLFFIFLTALFFTFSRGAWTGLAGGLMLILVFNFRVQNRQRIRKLIILGAGSIVLAGILFFNYQDLITTRFSGTARLEIKSNQERTASYHDAADVIKNNWLTGVGIGNYTRSLVKLYPTEPSWFYQPTHNVFLLVWAEIGIVGLILFIAIFTYLIFINLKFIKNLKFKIKNSNDDMGVNDNYFNLALLFVLLIIMLPDHYLWSLHFGMLFFWFLLGLVTRVEPQTDLTDVT
jgi:O-antigen ligase